MRLWQEYLGKLDALFGASTVDQWLRPLKVLRFDAANLYLLAESSFQIAWFEEHIRPHLKQHFVNNNHRPISVHLSFKNDANKKASPFEPLPSLIVQPDSLDPEMCFSNFVEEPCNQMATNILKEIDRCLYNPVFIYGPEKSGKTHLLMSAARLLKEKGKKVFFVRAERFTEHVVQAIRLGMMQRFRSIYRQIDALFIDNIDVLSKKTATQEELFHTFNTLHTIGKPIVFAARVAPTQLQEIEPRLISRCEWGISLPIGPASSERILLKKAEQLSVTLSIELIHFLLKTFPTSFITALQALTLRGKNASSFSLKAAQILLQDLIEKQKQVQWSTDLVLTHVAKIFSLTKEDLLGKSQERHIVQPRQIAMYLCREKLNMPYQAIGKLFGKDHSTVMSSSKAIQQKMKEKDPQILGIIQNITTSTKADTL